MKDNKFKKGFIKSSILTIIVSGSLLITGAAAINTINNNSNGMENVSTEALLNTSTKEGDEIVAPELVKTSLSILKFEANIQDSEKATMILTDEPNGEGNEYICEGTVIPNWDGTNNWIAEVDGIEPGDSRYMKSFEVEYEDRTVSIDVPSTEFKTLESADLVEDVYTDKNSKHDKAIVELDEDALDDNLDKIEDYYAREVDTIEYDVSLISTEGEVYNTIESSTEGSEYKLSELNSSDTYHSRVTITYTIGTESEVVTYNDDQEITTDVYYGSITSIINGRNTPYSQMGTLYYERRDSEYLLDNENHPYYIKDGEEVPFLTATYKKDPLDIEFTHIDYASSIDRDQFSYEIKGLTPDTKYNGEKIKFSDRYGSSIEGNTIKTPVAFELTPHSYEVGYDWAEVKFWASNYLISELGLFGYYYYPDPSIDYHSVDFDLMYEGKELPTTTECVVSGEGTKDERYSYVLRAENLEWGTRYENIQASFSYNASYSTSTLSSEYSYSHTTDHSLITESYDEPLTIETISTNNGYDLNYINAQLRHEGEDIVIDYGISVPSEPVDNEGNILSFDEYITDYSVTYKEYSPYGKDDLIKEEEMELSPLTEVRDTKSNVLKAYKGTARFPEGEQKVNRTYEFSLNVKSTDEYEYFRYDSSLDPDLKVVLDPIGIELPSHISYYVNVNSRNKVILNYEIDLDLDSEYYSMPSALQFNIQKEGSTTEELLIELPLSYDGYSLPTGQVNISKLLPDLKGKSKYKLALTGVVIGDELDVITDGIDDILDEDNVISFTVPISVWLIVSISILLFIVIIIILPSIILLTIWSKKKKNNIDNEIEEAEVMETGIQKIDPEVKIETKSEIQRKQK